MQKYLPSKEWLRAWLLGRSATYGKGRGGRGLPPSPQPGKMWVQQSVHRAKGCVDTTRGAPHSQVVHRSHSSSSTEPHTAAFACCVPCIDKCKVLDAHVIQSRQSPPMSLPPHKPLDHMVKHAPALSYGMQDEKWSLRVGHLQRSLPWYHC